MLKKFWKSLDKAEQRRFIWFIGLGAPATMAAVFGVDIFMTHNGFYPKTVVVAGQPLFNVGNLFYCGAANLAMIAIAVLIMLISRWEHRKLNKFVGVSYEHYQDVFWGVPVGWKQLLFEVGAVDGLKAFLIVIAVDALIYICRWEPSGAVRNFVLCMSVDLLFTVLFFRGVKKSQPEKP